MIDYVLFRHNANRHGILHLSSHKHRINHNHGGKKKSHILPIIARKSIRSSTNTQIWSTTSYLWEDSSRHTSLFLCELRKGGVVECFFDVVITIELLNCESISSLLLFMLELIAFLVVVWTLLFWGGRVSPWLLEASVSKKKAWEKSIYRFGCLKWRLISSLSNWCQKWKSRFSRRQRVRDQLQQPKPSLTIHTC